MGTARTRASNKWNAKAYDRVNLILKKEASPTKEEIQAAADASGESLNGYIVEAIRQRLESIQQEASGNLRTLASSGQIFLTAHSQARLYERGILLADIRQAIQSGRIIEYRPEGYRCPSCLVLGVNLAGRWLHVVCGIHEDALWIITAYWPDLDHWNATYTERKKKGE